MADHAVTQSTFVAHTASFVEPTTSSKALATPMSQASTAPDNLQPRTWSLGSSDFDAMQDDGGCVFSPEELPTLLLSSDPVAESYFIDAKEELVKGPHCPDTFDWGVFELLSETHMPNKDTLTRFSSTAAKPINVFTSSRAAAACKGETSLLENEDLAMWLMSGSPAAVAYFMCAQEEYAKICHSSDAIDWDVFELLSESHIPSEDILKRFASCVAKPVHTFSSSRAEFACQFVAPSVERDESM